MRFDKIKYLDVTCPSCNTQISLDVAENDTIRQIRDAHMVCPLCKESLSCILSSATHYVFEYNKLCSDIDNFLKVNNDSVTFND